MNLRSKDDRLQKRVRACKVIDRRYDRRREMKSERWLDGWMRTAATRGKRETDGGEAAAVREYVSDSVVLL